MAHRVEAAMGPLRHGATGKFMTQFAIGLGEPQAGGHLLRKAIRRFLPHRKPVGVDKSAFMASRSSGL